MHRYTCSQPSHRNIGGSHALLVTIEDDVWIDAGIILCPGVRIGKGSTVAAKAVVTKDVAEGVLVVGMPAKVLKKIEDGKDVVDGAPAKNRRS